MRLFATALVGLVLAAGALVPGALAADEPTAYAVAQKGTLKVVADVLLNVKGGEMKGVWLDSKQNCFAKRTLRVSIFIDLVDGAGKTTRVKRARSGVVGNCAEGGPNFGFDLVPRTLGMGCADSRWKPGRYSMTVRVSEPRSGLSAAASLYRQVTRRC